MSVLLDGYVAPHDGSGGWKLAGRSDDAHDWVVETVSNAGARLVGAATYAEWAAYWPGASGPLAEPMNEIPKVVFSNSLRSADWGETTVCERLTTGTITAIDRSPKMIEIATRRNRDNVELRLQRRSLLAAAEGALGAVRDHLARRDRPIVCPLLVAASVFGEEWSTRLRHRRHSLYPLARSRYEGSVCHRRGRSSGSSGRRRWKPSSGVLSAGFVG